MDGASTLRETASPAPAVTRGAAVLGLLAEPDVGALGLSELSRRLELPKSSVANLCSALEQSGLVRRSDSGYTLGHRLLELGHAYMKTVDLLQDFHESCRRLRSASQETVLLATLDGTDVLYLARHDGTQPIRLASDVGRRMPAMCTALGKSMLAQMDPAAVQQRLSGISVFPVLTPKSKRNMSELAQDLEATSARGFAIDDEENTPGVTCVAVALPLTAPEQQQRAVSVTMLKARSSEELRDRLVAELRELAAHLSMRLALDPGQQA
jgi:DNA-binding IclR family transcriptional regulator